MKLSPADEPLMAQIVSALLASGHYTRKKRECDHPDIIIDVSGHGDSTELTGQSTSVTHASIILADIKASLKEGQ